MTISRRAYLCGMAYGSAAFVLACSSKSDKPAAQPVETTWPAILLAAADAIIGLPIPDHGHYTRFFEFRFNKIAPYRSVYLRFASTLDTRSLKESGVAFVSAKPEARARLVTEVLDHDNELDSYIRAEVLALFARTDAFVMLGYDTWPGIAAGFEGLADPPRRKPS